MNYKTFNVAAVAVLAVSSVFLGAVFFWPDSPKNADASVPATVASQDSSNKPVAVSEPAVLAQKSNPDIDQVQEAVAYAEDYAALNTLNEFPLIEISSDDSSGSSNYGFSPTITDDSTGSFSFDVSSLSSSGGSSGSSGAAASIASGGGGGGGGGGASSGESSEGDTTQPTDNTTGTQPDTPTVNPGTPGGGGVPGTTNDSELASPAIAPIMHEEYFVGERELFGYSPFFQPGVVTFDTSNRPTIRYGQVLQTLRNEEWSEFNWYNKADYLGAVTGPFVDERVVFDKEGCAYTLATGGSSQSGKTVYLLFSPDYSSNPEAPTWIRYKIATDRVARLEFNDTWNLKEYPPAILLYEVKNDTDILQFGLIVPKKTFNTLTFSEFIPISTTSVFNIQAGGAGNSVVSVGNKIHVVYPEQGENTPQYARTYDRILKTLSNPVLIGYGYTNNGGSSDPHCIPVISADSHGFLHVVTGAHNSKMTYTKSTVANSTQDGWSVPYNIGDDFDAGYVDYYTYVAMVCDKNDTLHIVTRYYGEGGVGGTYHTGKYCLAYISKTKNGQWENPKFLVVPFHYAYSHYYHKLNIDRQGRLFVNYWYYADNFTPEEVMAYRAKWPDERIVPESDFVSGRRYYQGQTWHDPVILMSDNGGTLWRIAVTQDFDENL